MANNKTTMQYIISFETEDPIILKGQIEWIPTCVVGQSFLLHQICKMISLGAVVAHGELATRATLESALELGKGASELVFGTEIVSWYG